LRKGDKKKRKTKRKEIYSNIAKRMAGMVMRARVVRT